MQDLILSSLPDPKQHAWLERVGAQSDALQSLEHATVSEQTSRVEP